MELQLKAFSEERLRHLKLLWHVCGAIGPRHDIPFLRIRPVRRSQQFIIFQVIDVRDEAAKRDIRIGEQFRAKPVTYTLPIGSVRLDRCRLKPGGDDCAYANAEMPNAMANAVYAIFM